MTQDSLQESQYSQQDVSRDLYTQQELLFSEDVSQRIRDLGEDYQANPIALGQGRETPTGLLGLTIQYFGPNQEEIADRQELIFWNDRTGEKDGYGNAIAVTAQTPAIHQTLSSLVMLDTAKRLYEQALQVKFQREQTLEDAEVLENITVTSERLNKIQQILRNLDVLPEGVNKKEVRNMLATLNQWKSKKQVQRILKKYTEGDLLLLQPKEYLLQLLKETQKLNLLSSDTIRPVSLKLSVAAMLLRPSE